MTTIIVEEKQGRKLIDIFEFVLNPYDHFLAQDANGTYWVYSHAPSKGHAWWDSGQASRCIYEGTPNHDWEDTLIPLNQFR